MYKFISVRIRTARIKVAKKPTLNQKLLLLAKVKGITQTEIAKKSDMQLSHVNRYFNGFSDLTTSNFNEILKSLGIDLDRIVSSEINKFTDTDTDGINDLNSGVNYLLNSLDDLGKQTVLNQLLWAAKTAAQAKGKSFPKSLEEKIKREISLI